MTLTTNSQEVPVRIVGSSVFGRYPTISVERTYNMFVTLSGDGEEEWLTNFAGFEAALEFFEDAVEGRGFFHSVRGRFVLVVVAAAVYKFDSFSGLPTQLGTIDSTTGEISFDENLSSQICFVASGKAYIYNYEFAPTAIAEAALVGITIGDTTFRPNYVSYQNTYFLFGNSLTTNAGSQWVVVESGSIDLATAYTLNWVQTLTLQTKPDFAKAVLRIPGKGNNVIVFGSTVAELWTNVGGLLVYQRNQSVNIDFGAASVATIAANDEVVVWLGINENSEPALMAMRGGGASRISTDGLDYLFSTVQDPSSSTAFLYRQDGHLFYVLTFLGESDNFTIAYDFTRNKIYDLTDWDFTAFPARQMIYFLGKTYFLSFKDGKIYRISSDITTYDVLVNDPSEEVDEIYDIPRVRLTNTFRLPRPENMLVKMFTFVIESGTTLEAYNQPICRGYIITEDTEQVIYSEDDLPLLTEGGYCYTNIPRVDLTISKNGGITFSNVVPYTLKPTGKYQNQPRFNDLGYAQQITYQMRFWGKGRIVVKNGMMEIGK